MNKKSGFKGVARHSAVQALLGVCYVENLRIASSILSGERPECTCMRGNIGRISFKDLPLASHELDRLAASCQDCRRALELAADAWDSGNSVDLKSLLRNYQAAHARVRAELVSMA